MCFFIEDHQINITTDVQYDCKVQKMEKVQWYGIYTGKNIKQSFAFYEQKILSVQASKEVQQNQKHQK